MKAPNRKLAFLLALPLVLGGTVLTGPLLAQEEYSSAQLRDRGPGLPTSMFGTYIRGGQVLVYPFFAYTRDQNREYQPDQFGVGGDVDFRGQYWSTETGVMVSYGVQDWLALEFTTTYMKASLEKSPSDPYPTPQKTVESGLGDAEGQVRVRCFREAGHMPEMYAYMEITAPTQQDKVLIGDTEWDFKPGIGFARSFSWGTLSARTTGEYNHSEAKADFGETSIEYLKRLSRSWQVFLGVEGGEGGPLDEWHLVSDLAWRLSNNVTLKLDNTFGISSKANDWEPQFGILFSSLP